MGKESYQESDVTDVYSAVRSVAPEDVARVLFRANGFRPKQGDRFLEARERTAVSRLESFFRLIGMMQPNYENSSSEPLQLWDASGLEKVRGRSWPDVLGMRVVFPCGMPVRQKSFMISNLLTAMTCM